ncbi:zinc ribbon domain-containing protein [Halobacillus sp. B29]|uniref:zinc ribbon domain-containing protein n=1 Tax=Halobacillus sp. B29 TaxID=3457432 RepID=UPI003FCD5747
MKCTNCGNEQSSGKFCGMCGSSLSTEGNSNSEVAATHVSGVNENASLSMDKVKQFSGEYGQTSLDFLKRPVSALQATEASVVQGVISLFLYMVTFTLSIYFLVNTLFKQASGFFMESESLPFFAVSSRIFVVSLIGIVISFAVLFIVSKLLNLPLSLRSGIAQYGGVLIPFVGVNLLAIVFGLSGAIVFTVTTLSISSFFALLIVPTLFIYHHGITKMPEKNIFYWSTGTSLSILIISYLIVRGMAVNTLRDIESFLNFF